MTTKQKQRFTPGPDVCPSCDGGVTMGGKTCQRCDGRGNTAWCGCRINVSTKMPPITFCPKHAAAPEMYEALRELVTLTITLRAELQEANEFDLVPAWPELFEAERILAAIEKGE